MMQCNCCCCFSRSPLIVYPLQHHSFVSHYRLLLHAIRDSFLLFLQQLLHSLQLCSAHSDGRCSCCLFLRRQQLRYLCVNDAAEERSANDGGRSIHCTAGWAIDGISSSTAAAVTETVQLLQIVASALVHMPLSDATAAERVTTGSDSSIDDVINTNNTSEIIVENVCSNSSNRCSHCYHDHRCNR